MTRNENATCGKVNNDSLSCPYWDSMTQFCRVNHIMEQKDAHEWCGEHPDFELKETIDKERTPICSICVKDIRGCGHIPGQSYEVGLPSDPPRYVECTVKNNT